ncbi:MAG: ABC transporter permease [Alphaproteobacteria bacterium]|nr:ABC transporter permease [Alphaproteobacteria bacterium]MBN9496560.1 ABC transporter permease [Alphaproteobacteria bacterium]
MKRLSLLRIGVLVAVFLLLEALCRAGIIVRFTMQPPSEILRDFYRIMVSGRFNGAIATTLGNAAIAFSMAVSIGVTFALIVHRRKVAREALEPLFATYYAIPVLAFYPVLIILFGVGDLPKILIAFMLGVIAVITNTLHGLDRVPAVLSKTARVLQYSPAETAFRVTLPYAMPYMLTGVKFAVAYSLIGIVGSEFIMSSDGLGFEISFAYNNFTNSVMYPLILLVVIVAITLNLSISYWERVILSRRGLL